jgi:phospholipase C
VPRVNELQQLTQQVARNNFYRSEATDQDREVMNFVRSRIKHVIYIVKENRTYDQMLGDLGNGANGDPTLTQFGNVTMPNFHRLATQFVSIDNFMDPGDGSMDGWAASPTPRRSHSSSTTLPSTAACPTNPRA